MVIGYQVDEVTCNSSMGFFIAHSHIYHGFIEMVSTLAPIPLEPSCMDFCFLDQANTQPRTYSGHDYHTCTYHGSLIAGPYISDHRFITLETLHAKPKPKLEKGTLHKFTDDEISQFKNKLSNITILESRTLNKAAEHLNNEMLKTIDKIAPATTKAITSRHKSPGMMKT